MKKELTKTMGTGACMVDGCGCPQFINSEGKCFNTNSSGGTCNHLESDHMDERIEKLNREAIEAYKKTEQARKDYIELNQEAIETFKKTEQVSKLNKENMDSLADPGETVLCWPGQPPAGYVIVGWANKFGCYNNLGQVVKLPGAEEVVCVGSPIPPSYKIIDSVQSVRCVSILGHADGKAYRIKKF